MKKKNYDNWYILFVRGGHEKQIIDGIYSSLKNHQLDEQVAEVKFLEGFDKAGKTKNLLSSYLFVNCLMSRELLAAFYSTQGVISFLNHDKSDLGKNPTALSILEMNNFLSIGRRGSTNSNLRSKTQDRFSSKDFVSKPVFEPGNLILVREGFFKDHRGSVTKVDPRKETVTINLDFFGRLTPVSVKFAECEKI